MVVMAPVVESATETEITGSEVTDAEVADTGLTPNIAYG
jgi:hypothetical protein